MGRRHLVAGISAITLLVLGCGPAATATPQATAPPLTAATATPRVAPPTGTAPTPTAKPAASPTPAAAASPKIGGTARHPQREDTPSWDPSKTHVDPMNTTKYLVFSKLFAGWSEKPENCRSEVYPWAVQTWRWLDDTTAEFTLKQGIKYHNKAPVNGRELVAQDMVPSFDRYKKNLSYMAGKSATVEAVTVKDKYTFQMKLKSPWGGLVAEMLADFYGPWIEPAEAGGPKGELWEQPDKAFIGSGPFMFDFWTPGVKWRVVRNPDYWIKGRPYLDAVEMLVIPEASTQLAALRSGQLSLIREFSEELVDVAQRQMPGLQVVRCPGSNMSGAGMLWMNNSGPPFNDVRVRRAVAMAIDGETIVKGLYKGKAAVVAMLPLPTQYAMKADDFPADVRQYVQYNPAKAKQLLAEAGFPNGFDTVINFTGRYSAPHPMIAESLTGMLNAVGIRAKLNMMEYGRYTTTVLQAKYPVGELAMSPRNAPTPESAHALTTFWSEAGAVNRSVVNDPEYDRLYNQFRATGDENRRVDLARQLQTMAVSKAYAAFMPMPDSTMVGVRGLHYTWVGNTRDYSMLLETAWIE